jgi:hypothetical protein
MSVTELVDSYHGDTWTPTHEDRRDRWTRTPSERNSFTSLVDMHWHVVLETYGPLRVPTKEETQ